MKKKTNLIVFLSIVFSVIALTPGCDMTFIGDPPPVTGNAQNAGAGLGSGVNNNTPADGLGYDPYLPYLTITNLPAGTEKSYFSDVFIYDSLMNAEAKCADYNHIVITEGADSVTARIPLVYTDSGRLFRESGKFYVSFSVVFLDEKDEKLSNNNVPAAFDFGSGTVDFLRDPFPTVELGYFSGGLDNSSDTESPVMRSGTLFEMNGKYYSLKANMPITPSSFSFSNTCIVYVYARLLNEQIDFICSSEKPKYNIYKKGFYNDNGYGVERALYKFIFIRDSSNKCFKKTFINYDWTHFNYITVGNGSLAMQNLPQYYYLSGNPQPQTITLTTGIYLFNLYAGAGGNSYSSTSGSSTYAGGSGGYISEVVILTHDVSFMFFTGTAGENGTRPSYSVAVTGSFNSHTTETRYTFTGAGGGSGSFVFSTEGYFLCVGGGGGAASGTNYGKGGAGGSIGGGGSGGSISYSSSSWLTNPDSNGGTVFTTTSTNHTATGGSGGGLYNGSSALPFYAYTYSLGYNGTGTTSAYNGGSAAYYNLSQPYSWLNTSGINGQGSSSTTGGSGGNNRNSSRGGSSGNGSVTVYKIE